MRRIGILFALLLAFFMSGCVGYDQRPVPMPGTPAAQVLHNWAQGTPGAEKTYEGRSAQSGAYHEPYGPWGYTTTQQWSGSSRGNPYAGYYLSPYSTFGWGWGW